MISPKWKLEGSVWYLDSFWMSGRKLERMFAVRIT